MTTPVALSFFSIKNVFYVLLRKYSQAPELFRRSGPKKNGSMDCRELFWGYETMEVTGKLVLEGNIFYSGESSLGEDN